MTKTPPNLSQLTRRRVFATLLVVFSGRCAAQADARPADRSSAELRAVLREENSRVRRYYIEFQSDEDEIGDS